MSFAGPRKTRVVSLNVNGIRAATRKGFFQWLSRQRADIVCLQEIRAHTEQLAAAVFHPKVYHCKYVPSALRKGYSGVAVFSRTQPANWIEKFGNAEFDNDGRYLEARFPEISVISLYLPSGSSAPERQEAKFRFMDAFGLLLQSFRDAKRHYIICGDWNIAHKEVDLKNWRGNLKNSGFLPEERSWLDHVFYKLGFNDAFREVCMLSDQYTWWSNRGQARANNVGWRIDYQITSPSLKGKPFRARIYKGKSFSDHAPLIIDYAI